jgi:MFS transporter, MCT family, solute carrier family 16 (monocarboxylic acid transporters), member 14
MGLEKLTNAFGLLMLFQGVAAVIGTPLAGRLNLTRISDGLFIKKILNPGFFMDLTGSYDFAFYIAGALITFSAVICIPLNWINRWEKKRELRPKVVV